MMAWEYECFYGLDETDTDITKDEELEDLKHTV
jgi:hypothetical protein